MGRSQLFRIFGHVTKLRGAASPCQWEQAINNGEALSNAPLLFVRRQLALGVALDIPILEVLLLGVDILASTKADLDLHLTPREIHLHGNNGQTTLVHLGLKHINLMLVQQQAAATLGIMLVVLAGLLIGSDMHAYEKGRAIVKGHVPILEGNVPPAQGFDFGPEQRDAGFKGFENLIQASSLLVRTNGIGRYFLILFLGHLYW